MSSSKSSSARSGSKSRKTRAATSTATATLAPPIVLSIAGYDPSAGAGVLADLKTFAALGVYGMACVTALTVQSTQGVRRVQAIHPGMMGETLACLSEDVSFAAIKVGMLGKGTIANVVAEWLESHSGLSVVLDPVIKSSHNNNLLDSIGIDLLRTRLLARVDWLTPNLEELALLTAGTTPSSRTETEDMGCRLIERAAVFGNHNLKLAITGGHLAGAPDDLLLTTDICRWFPGERIETTSTHGTGCTFSSAIAAYIAHGDDAPTAMEKAKKFVAGALRFAYPIGRENGPLNHFWQQAQASVLFHTAQTE